MNKILRANGSPCVTANSGVDESALLQFQPPILYTGILDWVGWVNDAAQQGMIFYLFTCYDSAIGRKENGCGNFASLLVLLAKEIAFLVGILFCPAQTEQLFASLPQAYQSWEEQPGRNNLGGTTWKEQPGRSQSINANCFDRLSTRFAIRMLPEWLDRLETFS
ncbi:hypothetical protein P175DRAFT_0536492 [Aspergillus ochraceoroseus IBT 24754]|uniref:Uncharacterized protein n=1 Tax=Aspergillus ochraceoroseus IBT 24754 TaxID=1392256 RepID=A0A2T5LKU1_9EURO|nr:uncharacterized protein P175DRAFT_0536492 [Aspergillus ochraceoroseus IBT 24754]PTU16903.1 hypothetical protein P175DRAFT_0536492 [Aspergillus ochraceoroseus IBT 24754]